MKFKIKNKKIIKLLLRSFVLSSFLFLFFVLTAKNSLAADFRVNVGSTEWKINSDGIYKNNSKIHCADIQIGSVSGNGFLVKNSAGDKLLLIDENNIHTSTKNSFSSLTYPSSLTNSFILKKEDNDILLYVDANGLHYREGMCLINPICGNDVIENGEECDDGNTISGDGCSADCQNEYCYGNYSCNDINTAYEDTGGFYYEAVWSNEGQIVACDNSYGANGLDGCSCQNHYPCVDAGVPDGNGGCHDGGVAGWYDSLGECDTGCNCDSSDGCGCDCSSSGGKCTCEGTHLSADNFTNRDDCLSNGYNWGSD